MMMGRNGQGCVHQARRRALSQAVWTAPTDRPRHGKAWAWARAWYGRAEQRAAVRYYVASPYEQPSRKNGKAKFPPW